MDAAIIHQEFGSIVKLVSVNTFGIFAMEMLTILLIMPNVDASVVI